MSARGAAGAPRQKRKPQATRKEWEPEKLYNALKANFSQPKPLSVRDASRIYHVPKTTFSRYRRAMDEFLKLPACEGFPATFELFQSVFLEKKTTVLPLETERELVTRLLKLAELGFPLTKKYALARVQEYVRVNNIPHPWGENGPGRDWWRRFKRRWPKLSIKKPAKLSAARKKCCNEYVINQHFDRVDEHLTKRAESGLPPYVNEVIYNCDETQTSPDSRPSRVIGEVGKETQATTRSSSEHADHSSLLACISAAGGLLPFMLILKGERNKADYLKDAPAGTKSYMTKKVCTVS